MTRRFGLCAGVLLMMTSAAAQKSGFIAANGIRLHYLDWGGAGPALILLHPAYDNAHLFDDLAPALRDRFHVIAYDRRGHGESGANGAYDTAVLTEDLRGLMDAMGIRQANLAGWSMGGNEITAMAGTHPERVDRMVYLDGAYDWGDPDCVAAFQSFPVEMNPPATALMSLNAYRDFQRTNIFPTVNPSRIDAFVRGQVIVQPDGTVRQRMRGEVAQSVFNTLLTSRRDYRKVRAPALAIYAASFLDTHHGEPAQIAKNRAWEEKYMVPFRAKSKDRVRRELPSVEIVDVAGTHLDFVFASREQVVAAMRRFLTVQ